MLKSLFKITYKKNITKYLLLGIIYILLFVCLMSVLAFNNVANDLVEQTVISNACNNHIAIKGKGDNRFFESSISNKINNKEVNTITEIFAVMGMDKDDNNIGVIGLNINNLSNLGVEFIQKSEAIKEDNAVLISQSMANLKKIKLNDELQIKNDLGEESTFKVAGICKDTSFFIQNSGGVIINISVAQEIWNKPNQISSLYIQINDMENIDEVFLSIGKNLEDDNVLPYKLIDIDQYNFYVQPVKIMLLIFSVIAGILALLISFYTFKRIIEDRMPQYGKLMSLGATKQKLMVFILCETLCFTFIISILGSLISIWFISFLFYAFIGINAVTFNLVHAILLFLVFFALTFIMIYFVASKNFNKGIIKLIKGEKDNNYLSKKNRKNKILGCISILVALIFIGIAIWCLFLSGEVSQIFGLILFVFGGLIIVFYLLNYIIKVLKYLSGNFFPKANGMFTKAEKSILKNKGNIFIIFTLTILISIVGVTKPLLIKSIGNFYSDIDMVAYVKGDSFSANDFTHADSDIDYVYKSYSTKQNIKNESITLIGINTENYKNYNQDIFNQDLDTLLEQLKNGDRQLFVSNIFLKSKNLSVGDSISIESKKGLVDYKIIGSYDTFDNQGKNFILSENVFFNDFVTEMTQFFIVIKDNTAHKVMLSISQNELFKNKISLRETSDLAMANSLNAQKIITVIELLIVILCLLSAFSWFINMYINIKSEMSTYIAEMTLGKSRKRMALETSIIYIGIIGLIVSILASLFAGFANYFIINILSYSVGNFNYIYSFSGLAVLFIVLTVTLGVIFPIISVMRKNSITANKEDL